jgi:hydrogenase expression/formation protein HypC
LHDRQLICVNLRVAPLTKLPLIAPVGEGSLDMCLAIPMRVVAEGQLAAWCEGRGERRRIDLTLIGPQPEGTWVVAFRDVARQVLTADEANTLNLALDGLEAALRGGTADFDAYFPDLAGRAPALPENLRSEDRDR